MKRGPADLGPVGAQCPSGSVGSRGLLSPRAVGPLVEKTGSWAIAPRPVVSAPSLPTGPRARHLNPLNLTFLPVRHRHLLPLGAISQMRNVTLETDPEESSTLPRVTQLTTAESGIEPWCLVHGSRCRGSAGWRPEWPRGMPPRWDVCPEAPASWPARWKCVGRSLTAPSAAGDSLGLGAFALCSGSKDGRQVTGVVALPPALSFPMLLLLHHFGRWFVCGGHTRFSQGSQGNGDSLNFQLAAPYWLAETINVGPIEWLDFIGVAAGKGGRRKSFDLSDCFLNVRLKIHFRFRGF